MMAQPRNRISGNAQPLVRGTLLILSVMVFLLLRLGIAAGQRAPAPPSIDVALIDLNDASADELRLLPGIGPALAERIVSDRQAKGPYLNIEDLQRVKRIGPATADRLRPFVVIDGSAKKGDAPER